MGVDYSRTGDGDFYVKKIKVKATGIFLTNDRYYSFFSLPEQVLTHHQMKMRQLRARCEAALGFALYSGYCELGGRYEFVRYYASDYVTYQPRHIGERLPALERVAL